MTQPACRLCEGLGGRLVWRSPDWRLVHAGEAGFPGFYRLVRNDHVREFSQLAPADRLAGIEILATVEAALLRHLGADKINLASLGNAVPHLHWHVIARFAWDSHFPGAVWAAPLRDAPADRLAGLEQLLPALERDLVDCLGRAA